MDEPKREGGFMSKSVTYAVHCAKLNTSVRRGVKDFDWLITALKVSGEGDRRSEAAGRQIDRVVPGAGAVPCPR